MFRATRLSSAANSLRRVALLFGFFAFAEAAEAVAEGASFNQSYKQYFLKENIVKDCIFTD